MWFSTRGSGRPFESDFEYLEPGEYLTTVSCGRSDVAVGEEFIDTPVHATSRVIHLDDLSKRPETVTIVVDE